MKRDKLYTVNKYNKPAFMRDKEANFFDGISGSSFMNNFFGSNNPANNTAKWDLLASKQYGANYGDAGYTMNDYMNSKNAFGISKQNNMFSKGNIGNTMGALPGVASGIASGFGKEYSADAGNGFGFVDNTIAGGQKSKLGVAAVNAGASLMNKGHWLAGGIVGTVGTAINLLAGTKVDEEKLAQVNDDLNYGRNFVSNAGSMDSITGPRAFLANANVYSGGPLSSASKDNRELNEQYQQMKGFVGRSIDNNIDNIKKEEINDAMFRPDSRLNAYGGELDTASPTGYSFLSDILLNDKTKEENKNKMSTNNFNYFGDASNEFARGGKIHINPKNKGKFNATKKRTGKTTEELTHSSNPLTRKRAIFAQNARKWKHADGGPLNVFEDGGPRWTTSVGSVGPGGFIPNNLRGTYGGGIGLGGGAGTKISDIPEYETTVQNDTIWLPVTRNFNQAWREAVKQGKDTLHFNGGTYPIEYSDNPGWKKAGDAREEVIDLLPLITEKKKTERKKAEGGPLNILCGGGKFFDLGGDIQTNGADFPTGLTHIDEGMSHELNPYGGVQVGVDSEGVPNLVEEGEVIWNDYVFSDRIQMDNEAKEAFHVNKKREITYAEEAKKLEKEVKERPNDPISKAAFSMQMDKLEEQQERQKAETEARRAKEAFEALSPEEQTAVMQQAAEQEQAAQDAAMQQQAMAQQQTMQPQMSPEEAQMMQQEQMMQAEPQMGQQPVLQAYGGNLFAKGGVLKLLNKLGYKSTKEAKEAGWSPSDFGDYKNWTDINNDSELSDNFKWTDEFSKRITAPEMRAALSVGWNPLAELVGRHWYEGHSGNDIGWSQSYGIDNLDTNQFNQYATRYPNTLGWAIKNRLIEAPKEGSTISTAAVAKAMSQAPDWKKTDKWLYEDIANQAKYIGMVRNMNPDDDTKFINKWSPYGSFERDGDNWVYNLRGDLTDAEKEAFKNQFIKGRTDNKIGVMYNTFEDPTSALNRYVLDEKGNPSLITEDDLSNYEQVGNPFEWGDPDKNINNTAIFYRPKQTVAGAANAVNTVTPPAGSANPEGSTDKTNPANTEDGEYVYSPVLQKETNIGMHTPLFAAGLVASGFGNLSLAGLDRAAEIATNFRPASWQPRGDFARYVPNDTWFYTSPILGKSNSTQKALANKTSPTVGAEQVANAYNTMIALGNAQRQQSDDNHNKYMTTKQFNGTIYDANAQRFGETSRFNADAFNDASRTAAQLKYYTEREKLNTKASRYNSLFKLMDAYGQNIANREREIRDRNWISRMAADELLGNLGDSYTGQGIVTREWRPKQNSSANGGEIKRKKNKKKGLTI